MRKHLTLAAAAAMLVSMPLAAEAFPVAASPATGSDAQLTLVAGGCGIGFHGGPVGGCRRNGFIVRRPVVVVRRPVVCRIVGLIPHRVCRRW